MPASQRCFALHPFILFFIVFCYVLVVGGVLHHSLLFMKGCEQEMPMHISIFLLLCVCISPLFFEFVRIFKPIFQLLHPFYFVVEYFRPTTLWT